MMIGLSGALRFCELHLRRPMKSCCKDAMSDEKPSGEAPEQKKGFAVWLKRIGIAGFLFFLLKGLAWIFVLWGGAKMFGCD